MRIINDTQARKIASEWHSGGGSPLYVLSSTGAISNETVDEINENIREQSTLDGYSDLYDLRDYCQYHGIRGPQDGWANLNW